MSCNNGEGGRGGIFVMMDATRMVDNYHMCWTGILALRGDRQEIEILLWALVVALACCLYAPELDIQ